MKTVVQAAIVVLLLMPAAAFAQKSAIQLKSAAEVDVTEKNAKGEMETKRKDVSQAKVIPGDVVIFTTTYTNTGKDPATGVVVTNPVPEHMVFVAGSAEGKDCRIEFSADNGKTFASADKLTVTAKDGKVRSAGAEDITNIRWTLLKPLAPGAAGSAAFRARLK